MNDQRFAIYYSLGFAVQKDTIAPYTISALYGCAGYEALSGFDVTRESYEASVVNSQVMGSFHALKTYREWSNLAQYCKTQGFGGIPWKTQQQPEGEQFLGPPFFSALALKLHDSEPKVKPP